MRRLAATLTTIGIALGAAGTADAAKNPTRSQRAAIAEYAKTPAVCLTIKTSTARRGWASYTFRDNRKTRRQCAQHASNGITVVQRSGKRWRQRWAGSECPKRTPKKVPASVWRDLTRSYCGAASAAKERTCSNRQIKSASVIGLRASGKTNCAEARLVADRTTDKRGTRTVRLPHSTWRCTTVRDGRSLGVLTAKTRTTCNLTQDRRGQEAQIRVWRS